MEWCAAYRFGNKTCRASPWPIRGVLGWTETLLVCHGPKTPREFAWKTMEHRKRLFCYIVIAAELCLASAQVLRIGKRNTCLRTGQNQKQDCKCVRVFIFTIRNSLWCCSVSLSIISELKQSQFQMFVCPSLRDWVSCSLMST